MAKPRINSPIITSTISLLIVLVLLVHTGCTLANSTEKYHYKTSYKQLPIQTCFSHLSQSDILALKEERSRLIVHIQNKQRSKHYGPNFKLSLVSKESKKIFFEQFAMHPDIISAETNKPKPQRFSFKLQEKDLTASKENSLCFEIEADVSPKIDKASVLLITLELQKTLK